MRWEDERYIRLFTRDTTNWVLAPWEGRAVLPLVMRKLDRAGTVDLGEDGLEGLAALIQVPLEVVEAGMAWWMAPKRRTLELRGTVLVMPKFLDAQEAHASDRLRARQYRERARDVGVTQSDAAITNRDDGVTPRDDSSRLITGRHESSRAVTPSRAVPCLAVPSREGEGAAPGEDAQAAPPAPAQGPRKPAKATERGTRLTPNWEPSQATLERFRTQERVDARGSIERFRNHFIAMDPRNRNATKLDWERTFTNWVIEDIARGKLATISEGPSETRLRIPEDALPPGEQRAKVASLLGSLAATNSIKALGNNGG